MPVVFMGAFLFILGLWGALHQMILANEYVYALKGKSLDVAMAVSIVLSLAVMVPLIYFHNVEKGSESPLWLLLFFMGVGPITWLVGRVAKRLGY